MYHSHIINLGLSRYVYDINYYNPIDSLNTLRLLDRMNDDEFNQLQTWLIIQQDDKYEDINKVNTRFYN